MSNLTQFQLNTANIRNVPFHLYEDDFKFFINGEEFRTSKLISQLLSPKICKIYASDPTSDTFSIFTKSQGNFSLILKLLNFEPIDIPENELSFVLEVIKQLEIPSIDIIDQSYCTELTIDNVITFIQKHEQKQEFYSKRLTAEIDFISSHFYEICESKEEELTKLHIDTIQSILTNPKLLISSEDQLLNFINQIYAQNPEYSNLYEAVYFVNISSSMMSQFIDTFDFNDMTSMTWFGLSIRLKQEIQIQNEIEHRYFNSKSGSKSVKCDGSTFAFDGNNAFSGIINHLKMQGISFDITASSTYDKLDWCQPQNVAIFNDKSKKFKTKDEPNSWLCLEFNEHQVIPTAYTIRSRDSSGIGENLKSWVIEGSNDKCSWEVLDENIDCKFLDGTSFVHTFIIEKKERKKYRFVRIRQTGQNWGGNDYLVFEAFEIYGSFI